MHAGAAPRLVKPQLVIGSRLRFRNAQPEDAQFILSLRLDPAKNRHISKTADDLAEQVRWLERYRQDEEQVYFIIVDSEEQPVGTVRIYDVRGHSFCWGSWILADTTPPSSAVESTLMLYEFGLACGFTASHFEVRRANERVWRYHERFGATRIGADADNFYYSINEDAIRRSLEHYQTRIPSGVKIVW